MKFGLDQNTINKINSIFSYFANIESVKIYGSRAKGNFKEGSDIDLTFWGESLNLEVMNEISLKIEDLNLPYTFDLSIYNQIDNLELKDHINRVGQLFYQK
jgi:predicted nucleotidyltransferase